MLGSGAIQISPAISSIVGKASSWSFNDNSSSNFQKVGAVWKTSENSSNGGSFLSKLLAAVRTILKEQNGVQQVGEDPF